MLFSVLLALALVAICIWGLAGYWGVGKNLPPGPLKVPVIGTLLLLSWDNQPFRMFIRLAKKYGNIIYIKMGAQDTVVLSSYESIKEALVTKADIFNDRPRHLSSIKQTSGAKGVIWQNGETWKALRRFTLSTLRDFGVGKNLIEERIMAEVEEVTQIFLASEGKPVEGPKEPLGKAIANIISALVFGNRFEYDDPELIALLDIIAQAFAAGAAQYRPETYLPFLRFIPQNNEKWKKILAARDHNYRFIKGQIDTHRKTYDMKNVRDFIDTYIAITTGQREGTKFEEADMFRLILDLYVAGSETTASSLNWSILYMTAFPEIQRKIHEEIDRVVGDRQIRMKDRGSLPYLEATLKEIERVSCIATMTVPHRANRDTTLGGFNIPQDTIVLCNLYAALRDPKCWDFPDEFFPERFLGPDGKIDAKKQEFLIPFGVGPRVCLGEGLARIETFLIFGNLMQRFKFSKTAGTQVVDLIEGPNTTTRNPRPYQVIITKR